MITNYQNEVIKRKYEKYLKEANGLAESSIRIALSALSELDEFCKGKDYGCFISIGENSYDNFNLTILDSCEVKIGNNVFMGTGVSIVTPVHPLTYQERNIFFDKEKGYFTDREYAKPITIEDNCWIASNVTIVGGVTIGEGSVIGAGSVVTRSIPPHSLAFGNPCKVHRKITEKDKMDYFK